MLLGSSPIPNGRVRGVKVSAVQTGRPPGMSSPSCSRGRLTSRASQISVADPPPSRFIASRAPSAAISSASSPSVSPASAGPRPSQATDSARMAAGSDVRIELVSSGREALGVHSVHYDGQPVRYQQRACLQEVAAWIAGQVRPGRHSHGAGLDVYARAKRMPRAREGHRRARDPGESQLSQGSAGRPHEEAADDRVRDREPVTPGEQRLGPGEGGHAHLRRLQVVGGQVNRRCEAVGELHAKAGGFGGTLAWTAGQRVRPDRGHVSKVRK